MLAVLVELNTLPGDDQKVGCRRVIVDGVTQVGQRLVEAVMGAVVRHVRPEQAGQLFARMGTRHLDRQERQQGAHLGGLKARRRLPVQQGLKRPHQGQC